MDLTTINQMQYTAALLITNKITPPKPATNRKPRGGPSAWQQDSRNKIDQLRGDISIVTEYTNGNTTNKIRRKLKTILKKHKITADEQLSLQRGSKAGTTSQSTKNKKIYQKK